MNFKAGDLVRHSAQSDIGWAYVKISDYLDDDGSEIYTAGSAMVSISTSTPGLVIETFPGKVERISTGSWQLCDVELCYVLFGNCSCIVPVDNLELL